MREGQNMKLGKKIKTDKLNIAFLSRVSHPNGTTKLKFAIFDSKNNYKTFEIEYLNNIILN